MFGFKLIRKEDHERLLIKNAFLKEQAQKHRDDEMKLKALKNRLDMITNYNMELTIKMNELNEKLTAQSACEKCRYDRMFETQYLKRKV